MKDKSKTIQLYAANASGTIWGAVYPLTPHRQNTYREICVRFAQDTLNTLVFAANEPLGMTVMNPNMIDYIGYVIMDEKGNVIPANNLTHYPYLDVSKY